MAQIKETFYVLYQIALVPGLKIVAKLWWLWLFMFSAVLLKNIWEYYRAMVYKSKIRWSLLEIRIPREIRKSPKAMEQILNKLYSLRNTPENFVERYWEGEVTEWWSLEMAQLNGETHLYVRTPAKYKNIVEAAFYGNYKDLEIVEVDDYVNRLPEKTTDIYKMGLDLFGLELSLGRSSAYPFKTYPFFEAIEEEKSLDPMSVLIEVLAKLKKEEHLWLQILIRPADPVGWQMTCNSLIDELKEKSASKRIKGAVEEEALTLFRSPGEEEVMKAVGRNASGAPFETIIRYIYFAPRAIFNRQTPYRGVRGAFAQYSIPTQNWFIPVIPTRTMVWWIKWPFFFPKKRLEARKQRILINFRKRVMPPEMKIGKIIESQFFYFDKKSKPAVMCSEGIATLFHPPSFLVLTAPFIKRMEAKRMGPPAGLPIFGEESEVPGLKMPEPEPDSKNKK